LLSYLAVNLFVFYNLLESLKKWLKKHIGKFSIILSIGPKESPMQHDYILELVETRANETDRDLRTRAKGLLQSVQWSTDTRLDDQPCYETSLAERDRLRVAIDKIDGPL
jgi:hypothetical protein